MLLCSVTGYNESHNGFFKTLVSRSSVEVEYRAMVHTSEIMWLKNLLLEFGFRHLGPMPIFCDNQSAIYIAQNQEFHERTKHIKG